MCNSEFESHMCERSDFENFKSSICHRLKRLGDEEFVIGALESNEVRTYFERKWYRESLYLLAMIDYISRLNNIPIAVDYDDIRSHKLEKSLYPRSARALALANEDESVLRKVEEEAIPEFKRFNIFENDVRNVV